MVTPKLQESANMADYILNGINMTKIYRTFGTLYKIPPEDVMGISSVEVVKASYKVNPEYSEEQRRGYFYRTVLGALLNHFRFCTTPEIDVPNYIEHRITCSEQHSSSKMFDMFDSLSTKLYSSEKQQIKAYLQDDYPQGTRGGSSWIYSYRQGLEDRVKDLIG